MVDEPAAQHSADPTPEPRRPGRTSRLIRRLWPALWRISLRTRLRLSILVVITSLVLAQSVIALRVAARAAFAQAEQRSQAIAMQVRMLLVDRLNQEILRAQPPPTTLQESRALWTRYLRTDPSLPALLEKLMASSPVTLEIQVCDEYDRVLLSSIQGPIRYDERKFVDFGSWNHRPLMDRLWEVLTQRREYAVTVPLGVPGYPRPLYVIRVIISSVLLRNELMPQIRGLAATSAGTLVVTLAVAFLFSNLIVRAFDRLAHAIDLIRSGEYDAVSPEDRGESAEVAVVRSKLSLLGAELRSALQLSGSVEHLLRSVEAGVLMFGPDLRLVLASAPVERLLGKPRWELIGRHLHEIFPPSTPLGQAIQGGLDLGRGFRDRLISLQRHEAESVAVLASLEPIHRPQTRRLQGVVVTLRDVESQKRLETQLQISTRLAAISRLTSGVAHEIKNPLNAIALYVEILKMKLAGQATVNQELEIIQREVARLDRVVKTFLDFTKPVELKIGPVDLNALARELVSLVQPEAEKHGVKVRFLPASEPAMIHGDRDLLHQALLNVVTNGIEAMPRGGELTVELKTEKDEQVVRVIDQGQGIPQEIQDKIFNLYFTTKPRGTGVGLALAYRVVQLHSGEITFRTEVGRGTTFELRFPAAGSELRTGPSADVEWEPAAAHRRAKGRKTSA